MSNASSNCLLINIFKKGFQFDLINLLQLIEKINKQKAIPDNRYNVFLGIPKCCSNCAKIPNNEIAVIKAPKASIRKIRFGLVLSSFRKFCFQFIREVPLPQLPAKHNPVLAGQSLLLCFAGQ